MSNRPQGRSVEQAAQSAAPGSFIVPRCARRLALGALTARS